MGIWVTLGFHKGHKGANGSNDPTLPIPVKYLWNPTAAHPSTPSTRAASPPKTPTPPTTPSDKGTKLTHSEDQDEEAEEEDIISPPMKVGTPRGKRRKVASVPSTTRTSARLKAMNKSGKDEHPVTKGSKTSGRGGGNGKKAK